MIIEYFAKLIEVPIFRAGEHKGYIFSESDLDAMVADSNESQDFLKESIESGKYRENPQLILRTQIPALLNLGHQQHLSETIKQACKDISVKYAKKLIDGKNWIVATFEHVPGDVAQFLKDRFPLRSIELIRGLKNPLTKKTYANIIAPSAS